MKPMLRMLFGLIFLLSGAAQAQASVVYQDTFNDSNYTSAEGANGLSWNLLQGNAVVSVDNNSPALGLYQGTFLVTQQTIASGEYTVLFDASVRWSVPSRFVFFYKDQNNYYSVGLGGDSGIFRMLDGVETKLAEDVGEFVRLPHGGPARGRYKIYVKKEAQQIVIKADRGGDGVDYDLEIVDADPQALVRFTPSSQIGIMEKEHSPTNPWTFIDNVTVDNTFITDGHIPATLYVNAFTGDDSRSYEQAKNAATPWKTIQKATESIFTGDTVIVKPGTYPERINFTARHLAGKPGAMVTIRAEPRHQAECYGFNTLYGDYVRIEGFSIYHNLPGWYERLGGIVLSGHYSEAVDNYLHDLTFAAISGDAKGYRIVGNRAFACAFGIAASGEDWVMEGNEVERLVNTGDGDSDYSRFFGKRGVVRNNYFHGALPEEIGLAHVDGFQTFNDNGEIIEDMVIENNFVESFHQGVILQDNIDSHSLKNITIRNNIFVGGALGGGWGICENGIINLDILNNAFIDIAYHGVGFTTTNGMVKNNIFYFGGGIWTSDEVSRMDEDYNLIHGGMIPTHAGAPRAGIHTLLNTDPLFRNIWVSRINTQDTSSTTLSVESRDKAKLAVNDIVEYMNDGIPRTVLAISDVDTTKISIIVSPALTTTRTSSYLYVWKDNPNVQEDYRPKPASLAIDRGSQLVAADREGISRPQNYGPDIGPYETDCGDSCVKCLDLDQDGYPGAGDCSGQSEPRDCDEDNRAINPGASEVCDGIDNNCNGQIDEGFPQGDDDGDGFSFCRDNCPGAYNPDQKDTDADGKGDVCDPVLTYREDFEKRLIGTGDLTSHKTAYDFSWNALKGLASVENTANGKWMRMSAQADTPTMMVTDIRFGSAQFSYDIRSQWNSSAGMVFLVQDANNYYCLIHSGTGTGILPNGPYVAGGLYRVVNGIAALIGSDAGLSTTHNSGNLSYANSATVRVSFAADGLHVHVTFLRRYDNANPVTREFVDAAPAFASGALGFYAMYQQYNTIRVDTITAEEASAQSGILYGDVSENGTVSAYDASLTAQHAAGLTTLTPQQLTKAEVSGNGTVSAYDASLIAQYAAGLITTFPVGG